MAEKKKSPSRVKIRIITWVGLILFAALYTAYDIMISYPKEPHPGNGNFLQFVVRKGAGSKELATTLNKKGLINSPSKFGVWLKYSGYFSSIKAGEFPLSNTMSPLEIVETLTGKGTQKGVRITIPEGFKLSQIASTLKDANLVSVDEFKQASFDKSFLQQLDIKSPSAEGYLFPDTYFFNKNTTAKKIIAKMHNEFKKQISTIEIPQNMSMHNLVTLASIVQAEAKVAKEAPIIAGVYSNRLNKTLFPLGRLQADPTVAYGCDHFVPNRSVACNTFKGTLGSKQLTDSQNQYNTYKHAGLPPGPICAPGLNALKAAASPKKVPYLYFVVSKNGAHAFSKTLKEHQKAVDAYRKSQ